MSGVNLLIVNGHRIFREALRALLRDNPDIFVAAEVCNYPEAMNATAGRNIDIVVLDLVSSESSQVEIVRSLVACRPAIKILVLAADFDAALAAKAMSLGASGFLTTECTLAEVISAVRQICAGGRYIDTGIAHRMAVEAIRADSRPRYLSAGTSAAALLSPAR